MRFASRKTSRRARMCLATVAAGVLAGGGSLAVAAVTAGPADASSLLLPIVQTQLTFHVAGAPIRTVDTSLKRQVCKTPVAGNLSAVSLLGLLPDVYPLGHETVTIADLAGAHTVTTNSSGNFTSTVETPLHLGTPVCSVADTVSDGATALFDGQLSPILIGGDTTALTAS